MQSCWLVMNNSVPCLITFQQRKLPWKGMRRTIFSSHNFYSSEICIFILVLNSFIASYFSLLCTKPCSYFKLQCVTNSASTYEYRANALQCTQCHAWRANLNINCCSSRINNATFPYKKIRWVVELLFTVSMVSWMSNWLTLKEI